MTALRFALALLMLACCPQPAAALPFLPPDPDAPTPAASAYSDPMVWRSKVLAWAGLSAHTPDADEVDWWGEMHDAETAGTCEGCAAWAVVTGARAGG